MKNIDENMDILFRSKLKDHEVVPPKEVWEGIVSAMDSKKRKKRLFLIWGISSAASLLFAFMGGWYFANNDAINKEPIAKITIQEEGAGEKEIVNAHIAEYDKHNELSSTGFGEIKETGIASKRVNYANKVNKLDRNENVEVEADNESFIGKLLSSRKIVLKSKEKSDYSLIAMNTVGLSESDKAIMESNIKSFKEVKDKKQKGNWAVGLEASPAYRFDQSGNSGDAGYYSTNDIVPSYVTNITGGIKVSYNTGDKLSFQSGISYGEVSQKADGISVSYSGQNWVNDRFLYAGENKAGNSPYMTEDEAPEVEFGTRIGTANVSMMEGTNITNYDSYYDLSPGVARDYDLSQNAGYIEVPLILKYKLINSRFGLHILGGINTNFLVLNDVKIANSDEIIAQGQIDGLNPLTFSSSLGFGLNYSISKHFIISLEPTIKMQINSLSNQSEYNTRPYMVGVFTGISYNF